MASPLEPHETDPLDPADPRVDAITRGRRRVLAEMRTMSDEEFLQACVDAGIYTPDGQLAPPYRDDAPRADPPERRCPHCNGPIT